MPDTDPARLVTDDVVTAWYEAFESAYGVPLAEVERTDSEEVREALEAVARPMVAPVAAERDRLREALADEERQSVHYRDLADGLAAQVQRVRDLVTEAPYNRADWIAPSMVLWALDGGVSS
jgi:hypothetical protein